MESAKFSSVNKPAIQSLSVQQLIAKAKESEKAGKRKEALAIYIKAIKLNSQQPAWVYCHAIALLIEFERFNIGLMIGERALIAYTKSDEVYRALERLYAKPIDTANQIDHYKQLIAFEPQQPDWLYYNLAQQLWRSDCPKEAIKTAQRGTKLYGDFYPLHYLLGNILEKLKQWDKAIAFYQRVKQLNPHWLEVEQKLNQALYNSRPIEKSTQPKTKSDELATDVARNRSSNLNTLFAQIEAHQLSLSDCQQIWQNSGRKLQLSYGCWLAPSILYLEAKVNNPLVLDKVEILACSSIKYAIAKAHFVQISENHILGVACFQNNVLEDDESYRLCINDNNAPIFVTGKIGQKAYGLEFVNYLKTKTNAQKHLVRESLSSSIVQLIPQARKPDAGKILKKLQHFLHIPPSNYVEPNLPFKIFIDYIIPLKSDGLFISGWLQDAYEMLEKITIVSALGFSLELSIKTFIASNVMMSIDSYKTLNMATLKEN